MQKLLETIVKCYNVPWESANIFMFNVKQQRKKRVKKEYGNKIAHQ